MVGLFSENRRSRQMRSWHHGVTPFSSYLPARGWSSRADNQSQRQKAVIILLAHAGTPQPSLHPRVVASVVINSSASPRDNNDIGKISYPGDLETIGTWPEFTERNTIS